MTLLAVNYTGQSGFVSYSENTEPSYDVERQNTFNQTSVHHLKNTLTNSEVFQLSKKKKTLLSFLKYKINLLSEGQLLVNNSTKTLETVNHFHFLSILFYLHTSLIVIPASKNQFFSFDSFIKLQKLDLNQSFNMFIYKKY